MTVYYLAHPIAPDAKYTTEQNLEHILKIQKLLLDAGVHTVAPYFSWVTAFGGAANFKYIKEMYEIDCEVVVRLGAIILTGHKISRGMEVELTAARGNLCEIIDLTCVRDSQLIQSWEAYHED